MINTSCISENPLISIIIPTYNRARLIGETLDSILKQTYQNWECIIVDDGSVDNTDEVADNYIQKDARFKYYHRPKEHLSGGNGARNYGFKLSKGEYINWFDSDDVMKPYFLSTKMQFFEDNLDVVFCYGAYFNNRANDENLFPSRPKTKELNPLSYVKTECHLSIAGPLWKRSFLFDKTLFDEKRLKLQDVEFHFRMILEKPNYYFYLDDFLYKIRRKTDLISINKNITIDKVIDVFTYHFETFEHSNYVQENLKNEYTAYTKLKALRGYYSLISSVSSLKKRICMFWKHKSKLKTLIKSEANVLKKTKTACLLILITIFKKGFKFIQ